MAIPSSPGGIAGAGGMAWAGDLGAPQAGGCCDPGRTVSVPQKRHLEKSEGELPSSFEQRVQVMLHRIGVTKGPATEGKKQQVGRMFGDVSCTQRAGGGGGPWDGGPPARTGSTHPCAATAYGLCPVT